MQRKNLIQLMVAVTATVALCGYATASTPQDTAELVSARTAWTECLRAAIPRLDQPPLTADTVARAAMTRCADKYSDMVQALSRTLAPTCGRDSDCARAALAKAERDATQAAIDEVTTARIRLAGAQVLVCQ